MPTSSSRILVQTTILDAPDDWNVDRFALLVEELRAAGHDVTARNRSTAAGVDDPVLAQLSRESFDQLWLFAVDVGDGITPAECRAVTAFHAAGGGVLVTRDHQDLGSSVCGLGGLGAAHYFHTKQPPANEALLARDDDQTLTISWPNFHSGSNGDVQTIEVSDPVHPVLRRPDGSALQRLPAHPHEGGVVAPPGESRARVVARGHSAVSHRPFSIAVAFESTADAGPGWAESTFHHFADYNWDPRRGCPSFVSEPPSNAIVETPALLDDTRQFVRNLAAWLGSARA